MNRRLPVVSGGRGSLAADGRRVAIHPADVRGRFTTLRRLAFVVLLGIYFVLPWIQIGGRPALQLDIPHRRFFFFGQTANAQDIWLMFFLLTGMGFSLFVLTSVAGRVWCGWACPQTVFLEGIYRRIERIVEGSRERRIRRDAGGWTVDRIVRKSISHALYLVASVVLAHVVLSYFVTAPGVFRLVSRSPGGNMSAFLWTSGFTAALYFNFAWFREQTCVVVCPYGRLQSVLFDDNTLVVGYDSQRGEPRGKKSDANAGHCVDCHRCVAVCPTGIDIREGLQIDCIACTQCIDACDDVMDKLARPRGLIRYDSLNGLAHKPKRFIRPRLAVYAVFGIVGLVVATLSMRTRLSFEANLLRLRGMPPYVVEAGEIRNAFTIHVTNKLPSRATFEIAARDPGPLRFLISMPRVEIEAMGNIEVPIFVTAPSAQVHADRPMRVVVRRAQPSPPEERVINAMFLAPSS